MSYLTINAKVISEIGFKQPLNKKAFAFFEVFTDSIYKCKAFELLAEYARDNLSRGSLVCISGKLKKFNGEESLNVTSIICNDTNTKKLVPSMVTTENTLAFEKHQEAEGYVKTGEVWRRKKDCVEVDGKWTPKIEYVMDVFGAAEITRTLRTNVKSLFMNAAEASRYKVWLDKMVERAHERVKTSI